MERPLETRGWITRVALPACPVEMASKSLPQSTKGLQISSRAATEDLTRGRGRQSAQGWRGHNIQTRQSLVLTGWAFPGLGRPGAAAHQGTPVKCSWKATRRAQKEGTALLGIWRLHLYHSIMVLGSTADFSEALARQIALLGARLQHSAMVREENRQRLSRNKLVSGSSRGGGWWCIFTLLWSLLKWQ